MKPLRLKASLLLAFGLWIGLIACGYAWLLGYSFAPGQAARVPHTIPADFPRPAHSTRSQLFLALHPRCPCSMATVRELAKILTRASDLSEVTVLMFKPTSEPDSWTQGALLDECRRMKCQVRPDPDGRLATSLGGLTSGHAMLFDADGKLRYQGGITSSRGHEGDNAGEGAIIDILQGKTATHESMPVYGCPIRLELAGTNSK